MPDCRAMMPRRAARDRSWRIGIMIFVAGYWLLDLIVLRAGVPAPLDDTWEYGVAARHLLAGAGFRTSVILPPLWPLRDASLSVPLVLPDPPFPPLLAPLLAAFGPPTPAHLPCIGALADYRP